MGSRIRPLQGECLVYVDPPKSISTGGIVIPPAFQEENSREAIAGQVRAVGIWNLDSQGRLIPHPIKPGDRVLLSAGSGRWLRSPQERLKLVPIDRILALIEEPAPEKQPLLGQP